MASLRLQPPEQFNFKQPDGWSNWKRRFDQFRIASGLDKDSGEKQVSTLIYCMGEEAEVILISTNITEEERKSYSTVHQKLDDFFKVRKNVIYERARFNRRCQQEGESVEKYIMELYHLAENCEYGNLTAEMLRDRLVVGIRDGMLSERLQLDADLTLEKAKKMIRQREAIHQQHLSLKSESVIKEEPAEVQEIQERHNYSRKSNHQRQCSRCGRGSHSWEVCPARNVSCHRCKRKGHFRSQCRSKVIAEVQKEVGTLQDETSVDLSFLGAINHEGKMSWMVNLVCHGHEVKFKLDTGAEVTAISEATFSSLSNITLTPPRRKLYGPAHNSLRVMGQFNCLLSSGGKDSYQDIYVVKGLRTNLLGLPAIKALGLLVQLAEIKVNYWEEFSSLFVGLGNLGEPYEIQLEPNAVPVAISTPRNIPFPLRQKVKEELERMEKLGVISKVYQPTPWCAGTVVVPKKNGAVRICVDLKPLNKYVLRERHPLPTIDETFAQLSGARFFSKLDANSGYWQIPLSNNSKLLTTFITPEGRYCFNKLPFGISSAPEHFQKRMNIILAGLDGVLNSIDDILIFGKNKEEHDERLRAVLERIQEAGVTLNKDKCVFCTSTISFLGHIIGPDGVQADPEKTRAIVDMTPPRNISDVRRFLGMINQMGKFSDKLSELSLPLRELLRKQNAWSWDAPQKDAFDKIKEELCKPTILSWYNPNAETKLSADASSFGLGAVLLQKNNSEWMPVAFASRSMTTTETHYAQIEKEALAITWACDKFANYITGLKIIIETDHKPLIPLLGSKSLDNLPPRILRFRLRLARMDYSIVHVPGKLLYTADTLSRAPISSTENDKVLEDDAENMLEVVIQGLPASERRLNEYASAQNKDHVCSKVIQFCQHGWPDKHKIEPQFKPYWNVQGNLSVRQSLLLYGERIVVPQSLQKQTLQHIHEGHQGIQRSQIRARNSVWWPGIISQVTNFVENCPICIRNFRPPHEPLMSTPLPDYPWQKIASDLFFWKGRHYMIVVDYFSRYPEVILLNSVTSSSVISVLKALFARHGIPEAFVSDNGPQYSSEEFAQFASTYKFTHVTSSPYFPQSNGCAERAVQTVKHLMRDSEDFCLALLTYRTTPLPWCGRSPAELSMGRKLRANLPILTKELVPDWSFLKDFCSQDMEYKRKQKENYDTRHRVRPLPLIPENSEVWVTSDRGQVISGRVMHERGTPRSYRIETENGEVDRNRYHLNVSPSLGGNDQQSHSTSGIPSSSHLPRRVVTRSQTGTVIHPPQRYTS